jgi:hypothetical protein
MFVWYIMKNFVYFEVEGAGLFLLDPVIQIRSKEDCFESKP